MLVVQLQIVAPSLQYVEFTQRVEPISPEKAVPLVYLKQTSSVSGVRLAKLSSNVPESVKRKQLSSQQISPPLEQE
jgi:hypothetical protein